MRDGLGLMHGTLSKLLSFDYGDAIDLINYKGVVSRGSCMEDNLWPITANLNDYI